MRRLAILALSAVAAVLGSVSSRADWDMAKLDREIGAIELRSQGRLGVALIDLRDRKSWSHRGAERFPLQSVFKLPLAVAVLQGVEAGRFRLDQPVTIRRSEVSLYHSPLADALKGESATYPLRDLVARAAGDSDNTAADFLLRMVGGPQAVTGMLTAGGVAGMSIDRYERMLQPEILGLPGFGWETAIDRAAFNRAVQAVPAARRRNALEAALKDARDSATPLASVAFLEGLAKGTWLRDPAHASWLDRVITETKSGKDRLRAGLPKGAVLAHKTGLGPTPDGLNHATNDIGIVRLADGRVFAIAVYLAGSTADAGMREAVHAAVARLAVSALR